MASPSQSPARSPPPDAPGDSPIRGKSRSRSKSGSGRPRTRSKSGSPDSRARTRSRTGSPRSRSRSRSKDRKSVRRSRSRSRDQRRGSHGRRGSPRRSPARRSRSPPRRGGSSRRGMSPRRGSPRRGGSPRRSSPRRSRSRSGSPDMDGHRLHVADLDSNATKRDIESVFGRYGALLEIWMARSVPCFAFVVFRYKEDAYEACRAADGIDICGRRVRVTMARPRTRGRSRRGFDPSMRCYQCGERGHFSRDCPDTKYGYKRPPSRERGGGGRGGGDRASFRSRSRSGGRYDRRDRY